ncbi:MAG TPA: hypothetical protein VG167_01425 [Verrucomicrobiae bacterium]|nr:hypothetical protein [Verrucomicrobiae bacterium]HEV2222828.1 hypothetical protein [Candidatus Acidoferrales bacterium]
MKNQTLVERHAQDIKGVIECFDRVVLFGTYKAIGWTGAMEQHLRGRGTSFMEFNKSYANQLRLEVADHVRTLARADGLEIRQVNYGERKEAIVEAILAVRGRREGVVCILGAIERCRCFKVGKNQATGFLQLQWSPGKCQHFYVYFIDAEFGLCHLRIPTWAPFRLQFCCNGHDWLERQMKQAGLRFKKADNCFTAVSDFAAAQALLQKFEPQRLHRMLDGMAARWVAVHGRFGHSLHWSVYQAEWSTDIVFKNDRVLPELYRQIVRTAAIEVGGADIYRFLGKKPRANGKAQPGSRLQTLVQGTRLKHTLGATSLKMYDKVGSVLRIECTTSDVTTFKHRRKVEPRRSAKPGASQAGAGSSGETKWAPMRKTFYSLGAVAEAMSACNRRYLAYISQWPDRTRERHALMEVTASRRDEKDRSVRGVNFFRADDLQFLRALQRGEHQIQGVRNRTLQPHLPGWKPSRIGRTLRRFRVLQLIKPVAGTRKYYPTARGESLVIAGLQLTERILLPAFAA